MTSPQVHFHFVTLFPETIRVWFETSILGRALKKNLFAFTTYQLRDYADNKHRTIDDVAYGGGGGMVLKVEPLVRAVEDIKSKNSGEPTTVVYFSPSGALLNQKLVESLRPNFLEARQHFILICGHYEGVDQRFRDHWVDLEISMGDFVLTGGEIPAIAFADALARQLDGVLQNENSRHAESFSIEDPPTGESLLEHGHFTRPREFRGHAVPTELLSGDHSEIQRWRLEDARLKTKSRRAELVDKES